MRALLLAAPALAGIAAAFSLAGLAASRRSLTGDLPELGAASNFSQGWSDSSARAALGLPLRRVRDSIRWAEVERTPGRYAFDRPGTTWPDRLDHGSAAITLTLNWGNPLYDNGGTPHSPSALAAFGRFAAAVVRRFPQIDRLEIGNEVNSANFVSGPVKDAGLASRGAYHLAMVRAAADAVHAVRPDVRVIGGSTHSLPAGFLWPLLDLPGAGAIEGLAVHPYTTPIDQLPAQVGLLRRHGPAARLPLYVTEFGSQDPQRAADDLLRGYATLATLGTAEFDWYPFNERGDGLIPLVRRDGSLTAAGKAFRFLQSQLSDRPARDASPDPFTKVRMLGPTVAVIWGEPRGLVIDTARVTATDAAGNPLDPRGLRLAEDRAILLKGSETLAVGSQFRFGCSALLADSFHQFGYPLPGREQAAGDGFERYAIANGRRLPFEVQPGQQRTGVPWTPYLGRSDSPALRLMADSLLPTDSTTVAHAYRAERDGPVHLTARFEPDDTSADGIAVSLVQGARVLLQRSGKAPIPLDLRLAMRKGETFVLTVGANGGARGDTTRYRIRVHDEARCR